MLNSKLYTNLIDATNKIVNQFGSSIIQEDRFVNILLDMYPDRDNPAVYRIIRSAIQDGLLKNVLFADVKSIENQVATVTSTLSKRHGYDKSLVEGILFSLAIGYGTITTTQYNALKSPKNKPLKKQILPPKRNNNQNKQNPSKNTTNLRKKIKIDGKLVKFVLLLIWGIIGLTISPLVYLLGVSKADGFCIVGTIYVALLHFFTLVPIAASIDTDSTKVSPKTYPSIAGAMYGLMISAIIFWVVFPILFGFQFILDIWGINIKEPFPWIVSFLANFFCAGILGSYLESIEGFSGIPPINNKKKSLFANSHLFKSRPFKRGFLIVVSYFLLVGFSASIAPTVSEAIVKFNIYRINDYIDEVNIQKANLRLQREKESRKLGFAQFSLDDSYILTISKITKNGDYTVYNSSKYGRNLFIRNDNYLTIVDSIIKLNTQWNNERITVELFFFEDKLAALRYSPSQTKGDSIISIYTKKYGEPEYELRKYKYAKDDYPRFMPAEEIGYTIDGNYIESSRSLDKKELYPSSYYWTYKNSLIEIDYEKTDRIYFYGGNETATITYFSRRLEPILKRKKEKEISIQKEIEKKRNDSINRVREAEKRQKQEEERRIQERKQQEELNHKRSIEQI